MPQWPSRLSRRHFRWLQPLSPVGKSTCDKTQQFHTIPTHKLRLAAKGQVARKKKDKNYRQSCSVSENRETPTTNHWCPRSRPQHGHNTMTFDPFFCPRPASASLHHSRSARSDWRRLSLANPQRTEHCDWVQDAQIETNSSGESNRSCQSWVSTIGYTKVTNNQDNFKAMNTSCWRCIWKLCPNHWICDGPKVSWPAMSGALPPLGSYMCNPSPRDAEGLGRANAQCYPYP